MRSGLSAFAATWLLAAPAAAVPMPLFVVEEESSISFEQGESTPLSGGLTIDVGTLPPPGATPFDVVALSMTAGTNLQIGLDPEVPSPGLGILDDQGDFLIPTLFLRLSSPSPMRAARPPVGLRSTETSSAPGALSTASWRW